VIAINGGRSVRPDPRTDIAHRPIDPGSDPRIRSRYDSYERASRSLSRAAKRETDGRRTDVMRFAESRFPRSARRYFHVVVPTDAMARNHTNGDNDPTSGGASREFSETPRCGRRKESVLPFCRCRGGKVSSPPYSREERSLLDACDVRRRPAASGASARGP